MAPFAAGRGAVAKGQALSKTRTLGNDETYSPNDPESPRMTKTSLALKTLHAKPRKKDYEGGNENVDGHHLMSHFGAFLSHARSNPIVDSARSRYLQVKDVVPRGYSITVITESGLFGEPGSTYNVKTHEKTHEKSEDEAPTTESRLTVWAPPGATRLAIALEYKSGSVSGGGLVTSFREVMSERHPEFWFPYETVLEQSAWSASGQLLEVSVVQHTQPLNYSTGLDPDRTDEFVRGSVIHTAVPPRGTRYWPQEIWDRLRNRQIEAASFIGLRRGEGDLQDPDEDVYVTVERDGRQKKFALGTDGVPSVRALLTDHGQPPLDIPSFHREVDEQVKTFYKGLQKSWDPNWVNSEAAQQWVAHEWKA